MQNKLWLMILCVTVALSVLLMSCSYPKTGNYINIKAGQVFEAEYDGVYMSDDAAAAFIMEVIRQVEQSKVRFD